jgi:hypothetical protein
MGRHHHQVADGRDDAVDRERVAAAGRRAAVRPERATRRADASGVPS